MAIKSIEILNVMVFQRQLRKNNGDSKVGQIKEGDIVSDGFKLNFCDGINVLIGENGVWQNYYSQDDLCCHSVVNQANGARQDQKASAVFL